MGDQKPEDRKKCIVKKRKINKRTNPPLEKVVISDSKTKEDEDFKNT